MKYSFKKSKLQGEYDVYVDKDINGKENSWITTVCGKDNVEDFVERMNKLN